jgi:RND family efflux transporter MFP subunit
MATKRIRTIVLLVVGGGAVAALAATFHDPAADQAGAQRILPVETIAVQPVTSYQTVRTYTGTLHAARTAELSFERPGEIISLEVDQGDHVKPGQVLATLDTKSLEAQRRELLAQRAAAQAQLDELEAGTRPEQIAAARSKVRNLEAQVKLQELTLQRRETLVGQRAVSQAEFDQATYGLQSAAALLEAARQELAELEAGPREEKKAAQRAAVEQLAAAVAVIDAQLEDSRLVASFQGTITARHFDEGAVVAPGQIVFRLVEDQQLEAWFGLPVAATGQLQFGSDYQLRVGERRATATVTAIVPELDTATRTRRVVMKLKPGDATAYAGEIVRLDLENEISTEPAYWLPTTALVRGARGLWSCFVVVPETNKQPADARTRSIEKRDVKIVHTAGERVLVRGLLTTGDAVIAAGAHRVVPGQQVEVLSTY